MLNMIKDLINQKQQFQESADIIIEESINNNFDNMIILGEDASYDNINDVTPDIDPADETAAGSSPADINTPENIEDIEVESDDAPTPEEVVLDDEVLPDSNDDLLTIEIDLRSNTPKDILPVPPASASDVIPDEGDDIMNQKVDSGFGNDNETLPDMKLDVEPPTDIMDMPVESDKPESKDIPVPNKETDDIEAEPIESKPEETSVRESANEEFDEESFFAEAISLSNDNQANNQQSNEVDPINGPQDNAPVDEAPDVNMEAEPIEQPGDTDNTVTAAVKDKVNEMNSDSDDKSSSEKIMDKLSNITKQLEDAKRELMSSSR